MLDALEQELKERRGRLPPKSPLAGYLFAGSDAGARHAAIHYTLMATCRLHGIDAQAYLADVSAKIAAGWPNARLAELLPDAWLLAHPDAPRCPLPA